MKLYSNTRVVLIIGSLLLAFAYLRSWIPDCRPIALIYILDPWFPFVNFGNHWELIPEPAVLILRLLSRLLHIVLPFLTLVLNLFLWIYFIFMPEKRYYNIILNNVLALKLVMSFLSYMNAYIGEKKIKGIYCAWRVVPFKNLLSDSFLFSNYRG